MEKTKITIDINDFPKEIHKYLENADVYDSSCGENSRVLYSSRGYYIKITPKGNLEREADITAYLFEQGIGPEFVCYISSDKDYMVTRPARGQDATHYLDNPEKLCSSLAAAMKYLHSLPADNLPLSPQMDFYNSDGNLASDTFIHGDFCLPNIMLEDYQFRTFIDLGLAGKGDRHIDIFWCLWSLWFNLKIDKYTQYFLDLYGRENIDLKIIKKIATMEEKI